MSTQAWNMAPDTLDVEHGTQSLRKVEAVQVSDQRGFFIYFSHSGYVAQVKRHFQDDRQSMNVTPTGQGINSIYHGYYTIYRGTIQHI